MFLLLHTLGLYRISTGTLCSSIAENEATNLSKDSDIVHKHYNQLIPLKQLTTLYNKVAKSVNNIIIHGTGISLV